MKPSVWILGPLTPQGLAAQLGRAAQQLAVPHRLVDVRPAYALSGDMQAVYQRLWRPEPMHVSAYAEGLVGRVQRAGIRYLLACGDAPLTLPSLEALAAADVRVLNYSSDDPWGSRWNPWRVETLHAYAAVFTPRRANLAQLEATGCPQVLWLPFGYDPSLHRPATEAELARETRTADVVFIGGGDRDRAPYMRALAATGLNVRLYGNQWGRFPRLRRLHGGILSGEEMRTVLGRSKLSVCLVRQANRDEHVMRTYEEPAMGSAVLMQDTQDHRELFVEPAARAGFFGSPEELAARALALCASERDRSALRESVHRAVVGGPHTYADRLRTMLSAVDYPLA